jgi:hypothetical protein
MQGRLKNYALVICLFVFLFVIIGSGLHLSPGAAFLAAATGTSPNDLCLSSKGRQGFPTGGSPARLYEKRGCVCQRQDRSVRLAKGRLPDQRTTRRKRSRRRSRSPHPSLRFGGICRMSGRLSHITSH